MTSPTYMKTTWNPDYSDVDWGTYTDARDECFMAHEALEYTYGAGNGVRTYKSVPFKPWVLEILTDLNSWGSTYNVCFLNRYENEKQHLGWHSDDSPGMSRNHPIAVVSFGQEREIWWRKIGQTGLIPPEQRQLLAHGSIFVMPAGFQLTHQHRIPKGDRKMGVRVSLTFRHYIP